MVRRPEAWGWARARDSSWSRDQEGRMSEEGVMLVSVQEERVAGGWA